MFDRLLHLWSVMQRSWTDDPSARGAAKMTIGAILVFEGFFGKVRQVSSGKSKGKGGIMGAVIGVVVGVALLYAGSNFLASDLESPEVTIGHVTQHIPAGKSDSGSQMYREVFAYTVDGKEYTLRSSSSSTKPSRLDSQVEIKYSSINPANAHRNDGVEGAFHKHINTAIKGLGWFVLITSVLSLIISVVIIWVGVKVFLSGVKDRKVSGQQTNFVSDLLSIFSKIKSGDIDATKELTKA